MKRDENWQNILGYYSIASILLLNSVQLQMIFCKSKMPWFRRPGPTGLREITGNEMNTLTYRLHRHAIQFHSILKLVTSGIYSDGEMIMSKKWNFLSKIMLFSSFSCCFMVFPKLVQGEGRKTLKFPPCMQIVTDLEGFFYPL